MGNYKMLICDVCEKEFSMKVGPANNKLKHKETKGNKIYCSKECRNSNTEKRRLEEIDLTCCECGKIFPYPKIKARNRLKRYEEHGVKIFCSIKCRRVSKNWGTPSLIKCCNCGNDVLKFKSEIDRNDKQFCNSSCAAIYMNSHKTTGIKRSKLEMWLEEQLSIKYPNIPIMYCDKTTIRSELDIYIPSLKLAFELNGIFHYEPIFGTDKLTKTQNNDKRKFQACLENQIELCIIDTSKETYFKPVKCEKYLNIIAAIIDSKLEVYQIE